METAETPQTLGLIARIANLIASPTRTFASLTQKPDWITPILAVALLTISFSLVMKDQLIEVQFAKVREQLSKNPQISKDQVEQSLGMMKKFWVVGAVFSPIVPAVLYFIFGLFYWLLANALLRSKVTYLQLLSVYGYATMIESIGGIMKLPLMVISESLRVDMGPAILFPDEPFMSPWYMLLSRFDLFALWGTVLMGLGLSVLYKKPVGEVVKVVVLMWILTTLVTVGMSSLG